jgi:hypothetical protein
MVITGVQLTITKRGSAVCAIAVPAVVVWVAKQNEQLTITKLEVQYV